MIESSGLPLTQAASANQNIPNYTLPRNRQGGAAVPCLSPKQQQTERLVDSTVHRSRQRMAKTLNKSWYTGTELYAYHQACLSFGVGLPEHTYITGMHMHARDAHWPTDRLLKLTLHRWLTEEEALHQHKMHFCDHCTNYALVCDGRVTVRHWNPEKQGTNKAWVHAVYLALHRVPWSLGTCSLPSTALSLLFSTPL